MGKQNKNQTNVMIKIENIRKFKQCGNDSNVQQNKNLSMNPSSTGVMFVIKK